MSTPATFKRMEASKKRRGAYQDHSLSGRGGGYFNGASGGYNGYWGAPAGPVAGAMPMIDSWRSQVSQQQPVWSDDFTADVDNIGFEQPSQRQLMYPAEIKTSSSMMNRAATVKKSVSAMNPAAAVAAATSAAPETMEFTISPSNVVCFSGRRHFLSTMFMSRIVIGGHFYPSVEHYYQACKLYTLVGAAFAARLSRVEDPIQCKTETRNMLRNIVSKKQLDEWKTKQAPEILLYALLHKFKQNRGLMKRLLDSGDSILAHSYDKDNVYATGCKDDELKKWMAEHDGQVYEIPRNIAMNDLQMKAPTLGKGKNILGILLMQVREVCRGGSEKADPHILQTFKQIATQ